MKNISLFILSIFLVSFSFKNNLWVIDYRDACVGDYFCKRSCYIMDRPQNENDTLTINLSKSSLDSVMQINIGQYSVQVKLKNDILYGYPEGSHWGGKIFSQDSIQFTLFSGKTSVCNFYGKKK